MSDVQSILKAIAKATEEGHTEVALALARSLSPAQPAMDGSTLATAIGTALRQAVNAGGPGQRQQAEVQAKHDVLASIPVAEVREIRAELFGSSRSFECSEVPIPATLRCQRSPDLTPEQLAACDGVAPPKGWRVVGITWGDLRPIEAAARAHVERAFEDALRDAVRQGDKAREAEIRSTIEKPNAGHGMAGVRHLVWEVRRDLQPLIIGKTLDKLPRCVRLLESVDGEAVAAQ